MINNKNSLDKITLETSINPVILKDIYEYCAWANIKDINLFIEKSAKCYLEDKNLKQRKE
ncbi:Uncharacterised protein [Legionella wadsworthii]|uniref:Uncharacterized protein n=1 Tax=Legionella wadsworthii TaxID=28088 RepID=A0A378LRF7_9GAMM|nr:hypothetical protein [Legionella wadsworthii]STY29525.1 Uncharacterised protein [Legionella wadsworthii]